MDKLMKVVNDIIELNIQGATNVAIEGVKAYYEYISRQSANQNIEDFKSKNIRCQQQLCSVGKE